MRLAVIGAVALGAGFAAAPSLADVWNAPTVVTVAHAPRSIVAGEPVHVFGRLSSPRDECVAGRRITVYRAVPGSDPLLGRSVTDSHGRYRLVLRFRHDARVYARFAGLFESSYEHSHRCRGDASGVQPIDVRNG